MLVCSLFSLLVFGCYLYTLCVFCVPFPSAFNIFSLFTYPKKKSYMYHVYIISYIVSYRQMQNIKEINIALLFNTLHVFMEAFTQKLDNYT